MGQKIGDMYSSEEAAKEIGIAPETLRYYAWRYKIGVKIGGTRIYNSRDIESVKRRRELHKKYRKGNDNDSK